MPVDHDDSLAAVIAELTAPPGFEPEPDAVSGDEDRVPRTRISSHGPFARVPAAIAVHKERERDNRRLYAVSFDESKATGGFGWSPPKSPLTGGRLMAWPAAATDPSAESGERRDRPPWAPLRG